jgi:hypothetical protein
VKFSLISIFDTVDFHILVSCQEDGYFFNSFIAFSLSFFFFETLISVLSSVLYALMCAAAVNTVYHLNDAFNLPTTSMPDSPTPGQWAVVEHVM